MKHINIITRWLITLFFMSYSFVFGQTVTWSIADLVVVSEKIAINAELIGEELLKNKQVELLKELGKIEKEYEDKKVTYKNFESVKEVFAAITIITYTTNGIKNIESKIKILRTNPLNLLHGLHEITEKLEIEKRYLGQIHEDYYLYASGILLSGGVGYNYTAFIKLLIRVLKIRSNVLSLEKDIENLLTLNKLLIK